MQRIAQEHIGRECYQRHRRRCCNEPQIAAIDVEQLAVALRLELGDSGLAPDLIEKNLAAACIAYAITPTIDLSRSPVEESNLSPSWQAVVAPAVLSTYRRYRGRRTIICPETDQIVEMELKAGRAGVMAALGKQDLRVKWCSLWPRRKGCAEQCVKDDWPAAGEPRDDDRSHANGV